MHHFQIDPAYIPPAPTDRAAEMCWSAQGLLMTFMGEAGELEEITDEAADIYTYGGEDGLAVHDTTLVPIRSDRAVSLSNVPYVTDANGSLAPWTEPGYVALRSEPAVEDPTNRVLDAFECGQYIFRLPSPYGESAAIFDGWSLQPNDEIKPEQTRKLQRIEALLTVVRHGLQSVVETDYDEHDALYAATVPRRSTGRMVEDGLRELMGE